MTTVVQRAAEPQGAFTIICDCSPPRGGDPALLDPLRQLGADFLAMAYNPGKAVRVASVAAAAWLKQNAGADVTFTIAPRDMNRLALESLLLGAQLLGLENVRSSSRWTPPGLLASPHPPSRGRSRFHGCIR